MNLEYLHYPSFLLFRMINGCLHNVFEGSWVLPVTSADHETLGLRRFFLPSRHQSRALLLGGPHFSALESEVVVASSWKIFNLWFGSAVLGAWGNGPPPSLFFRFDFYLHLGHRMLQVVHLSEKFEDFSVDFITAFHADWASKPLFNLLADQVCYIVHSTDKDRHHGGLKNNCILSVSRSKYTASEVLFIVTDNFGYVPIRWSFKLIFHKLY